MKHYHPTMSCPYCGDRAELINSTVIYSKDYGLMYACENYPVCDAYVGCHKDTIRPKGRLANAELRRLKIQAHAVFDKIWFQKNVPAKKKGKSRNKAYKWLADKLGIKGADCHIGYFDESQCINVINICKNESGV